MDYEFYILLCLTWRLCCDYYLGLYIGQFRPIMDLSCWQKHVSLYHVLGPMFYAIVTSVNDFFPWVLWNFIKFYGTLRLGEKFRNFMELFNVSYGMEQLWV